MPQPPILVPPPPVVPDRPFFPYHRPPGHGGLSPIRPQGPDIHNTDRDQSLQGRRGHQIQWVPQQTIQSVSSGVAARATAGVAFPVIAPAHAIGYVAITSILSNTVTNGVYTILLHSALGNSGLGQAIYRHTKGMDNVAYTTAQQGIAPIVNGQAVIETVITGTVNVNFSVLLVGWILS